MTDITRIVPVEDGVLTGVDIIEISKIPPRTGAAEPGVPSSWSVLLSSLELSDTKVYEP